MGKVIIHGVKEDGLFDAEVKSTATLVTELIDRYTKVFEAGIYKAVQQCTNIPQEIKDKAFIKCLELGFSPFINIGGKNE